jgi:hypothetical protein
MAKPLTMIDHTKLDCNKRDFFVSTSPLNPIIPAYMCVKANI